MPHYNDQNLTLSDASLNSITLILLSSKYGRNHELSPVLDLSFSYSTEYMTPKLDYFPVF